MELNSEQEAIFGDQILKTLSLETFTLLKMNDEGYCPAIFKIVHITTTKAKLLYSASNDWMTMPNNQSLKDYLLDPSKEDKYIMNTLPMDNASYQKIMTTNASLQHSISIIDKEYKSNYSKYEELSTNPKATPYEIEEQKKKLAGRLPPMTDEQLCQYFKDKKIKRKDNEQYRLAYQRLAVKRCRSRQNCSKSSTQSSDSNSPSTISESTSLKCNLKQPFLLVELIEPEPVVELIKFNKFEECIATKFQSPKFQLEILPLSDEAFVNEMYSNTTGLGKSLNPAEKFRLRAIFKTIYDIHPDKVSSEQIFLKERIVQTMDFFGKKLPKKDDPLWAKISQEERNERQRLLAMGINPFLQSKQLPQDRWVPSLFDAIVTAMHKSKEIEISIPVIDFCDNTYITDVT
jgi:hypothetical protein